MLDQKRRNARALLLCAMAPAHLVYLRRAPPKYHRAARLRPLCAGWTYGRTELSVPDTAFLYASCAVVPTRRTTTTTMCCTSTTTWPKTMTSTKNSKMAPLHTPPNSYQENCPTSIIVIKKNNQYLTKENHSELEISTVMHCTSNMYIQFLWYDRLLLWMFLCSKSYFLYVSKR